MFKPHHISLLTGDANANAHFYIQVLGLRIVKNSVNQEATHIRHLYYGNNLGEPGSVVTFFVLDQLGHRQDANHGLIGIRLGIPESQIDFWLNRFMQFDIPVSQTQTGLHLTDPDGVPLDLIPVKQQLTTRQVVPNDIPADAQITGLLGTTIAYVDPVLTANFYQQWLGLPLNSSKTAIPLSGEQAGLMFQAATDPAHRSRMGRGSVDHVALQVPDLNTLFDYYQRALNLGANVELYRDRGWFQSIYVRDPSDNRIELATITPGFALEEPADVMGQQLSLPPLFADQTPAIAQWYAQRGIKFDEAARFEHGGQTVSN